MKEAIKKGPGGCKPKLPADKKRRKDTITLLPVTWAKLDKIGPSRGKAVDKLVEFYEQRPEP